MSPRCTSGTSRVERRDLGVPTIQTLLMRVMVCRTSMWPLAKSMSRTRSPAIFDGWRPVYAANRARTAERRRNRKGSSQGVYLRGGEKDRSEAPVASLVEQAGMRPDNDTPLDPSAYDIR